MPRVLQTIEDALLPGIFRRRRPTAPRQPIIGNDLPEQGGIMGNLPRNNVLMSPETDTSAVTQPLPNGHPALGPQPPRPAGIPANAHFDDNKYGGEWIAPGPPLAAKQEAQAPPSNMLAPDPVVSRSGQVMDEYATRPARRVETDTHGRPSRNITLEGDDQTLDYANRVAKYEPQKGGGGWWPRIRAAIAGFAAGGPIGAAAAFGTRSLREKFQPKLADEEWKREQLGQVGPAVESIRKARKDTLQEQSTKANIDLAKARTDALKREKKSAGKIVERKDGVYQIDTETGQAKKIAGIPPESGAPGSTRYVSRPDGVYGINAEHPEGFKVKGIPGQPGKDAEDATFSNAQINQAIQEAQAEQAKIDAGLANIPRTVQSTDLMGNPRTVANPDYTYNMTRRRQLDDDIRNWRLKLKSPKRSAAPAEDPDIRAYADQYFNGDYAAAEAAAKKP